MDVPKIPLAILLLLLLVFVVGVGRGARLDRQESRNREGGSSNGLGVDPENLALPGWIEGLGDRALALFGAGEPVDPERIKWEAGVSRPAPDRVIIATSNGARKVASFAASEDAGFQSLKLSAPRRSRVGYKDGNEKLAWTTLEKDEVLTLMVSELGGALWVEMQGANQLELRLEGDKNEELDE